jgi:SAM-dependent methyltransferase
MLRLAMGRFAEGRIAGGRFAGLRKYLLLPRLIALSSAAPKDPLTGWEQYWGSVKTTGAEGEVLWDSGSDGEINAYAPWFTRHLDVGLPVLDVGCGNGSFTRHLAAYFPRAVGVDASTHAVIRARHESEGVANVSFAVCDATDPDAMGKLRTILGAEGANVFIRGLLHVLGRHEQAALAENLRPLLGRRGALFLAETDFPGNAVEYVSHLGATRQSIPGPLEEAIRFLPMPGRFGAAQRRRAFPSQRWELVADGAASIETRPLKSATEPEKIPGYFAILRPLWPSEEPARVP